MIYHEILLLDAALLLFPILAYAVEQSMQYQWTAEYLDIRPRDQAI